jgi:hypothetical protein
MTEHAQGFKSRPIPLSAYSTDELRDELRRMKRAATISTDDLERIARVEAEICTRKEDSR